MTTGAEIEAAIEAAQRGCACPRIDAHDCAWVRAGMPHDDVEGGALECERCECPCHDEIDALLQDDED